MARPPEDEPQVHLAVDNAQAAGAKFARTLAGAHSGEFALALTEQADLIERAITDAGHAAEQAELAARHFGAAARDEWERIAAAGGSTVWGSA